MKGYQSLICGEAFVTCRTYDQWTHVTHVPDMDTDTVWAIDCTTLRELVLTELLLPTCHCRCRFERGRRQLHSCLALFGLHQFCPYRSRVKWVKATENKGATCDNQRCIESGQHLRHLLCVCVCLLWGIPGVFLCFVNELLHLAHQGQIQHKSEGESMRCERHLFAFFLN